MMERHFSISWCCRRLSVGPHMPILFPWDCVCHVILFMPAYESVQLVSRQWLLFALRQYERHIPLKWKHILLMYTHRAILRQPLDWSFFSKHTLGKRKRRRNEEGILTWEAAARWHTLIQCRCRSCGCKTRANVMGVVLLCINCRQNKKLKHAFMVKTYEARRYATKQQLKEIEYHGGNAPLCPHWRFWTQVVEAVPFLVDNRAIRRKI